MLSKYIDQDHVIYNRDQNTCLYNRVHKNKQTLYYNNIVRTYHNSPLAVVEEINGSKFKYVGMLQTHRRPFYELVRMRKLRFNTSLLRGENISCVIHEESILLLSSEDKNKNKVRSNLENYSTLLLHSFVCFKLSSYLFTHSVYWCLDVGCGFGLRE